MEIKDKILIAKDFTDMPVGRDKLEGDFNGELFLIKYLFPKFLKAVNDKYILQVDFTGIYGYPSSFISGSFGNLSLYLGKVMGQLEATNLILKHLSLKSDDNPLRSTQTINEIKNPKIK